MIDIRLLFNKRSIYILHIKDVSKEHFLCEICEKDNARWRYSKNRQTGTESRHE